MALEEQVGAIVLEVDGQDVEVVRMSVRESTGKSLVRTMNRSGKPTGYHRGVEEFSLELSLTIPVGGEPDWKAMDDARLTITPFGGGQRTSYTGCFVVSMGAQYQLDGVATRDLTLQATGRVIE